VEAGFSPPPEDEWPPLMVDLPYEAQEALRIFYILPPLVAGMGGYMGRDLSPIPILFKLYEVPKKSRRVVLDIILFLIGRSVTTANEKIAAKQAAKT